MSYLFKEKLVKKCRQNYSCPWCGTQIDKGSSLMYAAGVMHGEIQQERWHLECWNASSECEDDLRDGWYPGDYPKGGNIAYAAA